MKGDINYLDATKRLCTDITLINAILITQNATKCSHSSDKKFGAPEKFESRKTPHSLYIN